MQRRIKQLRDYPGAIAQLRHQILELDRDLITHTDKQQKIEASIDYFIAFSPDFKNDAQRKSHRIEALNNHPDYSQLIELIRSIQSQREVLVIELELLRNKLALLKLEQRHTLAQLEAQIAA